MPHTPMYKLIGLVLTTTFLIHGASTSQHPEFSKYKTLEAYEVRPGILVMPTYSPDGQLCEVGLEKLHYTRGEIKFNRRLSHDEIHQIFDELAPAGERGPRPTNVLAQGSVEVQGNARVQSENYENVSLFIYWQVSGASDPEDIMTSDIIATIEWQRPGCK